MSSEYPFVVKGVEEEEGCELTNDIKCLPINSLSLKVVGRLPIQRMEGQVDLLDELSSSMGCGQVLI